MCRAALLLPLCCALALPARAQDVLLTGAGATLPAPLYSKWASLYRAQQPSVRINYQGIGSGAGLRQAEAHTVDFGASDMPLDEAALRRAGLVQVPMIVGAVAIVFHLQGVERLRLTPDTAAALFLGEIRRWNDPALARENPGATLPDLAVTVVHRSDGAGSTAIFSEWLGKTAAAWQRSRIGSGPHLAWPGGPGARGSDGVTQLVQQVPGAVGYVELGYALRAHLGLAELRNREGRFVAPSLASARCAALQGGVAPSLRVSLTDAPGECAWPISSLTYLLLDLRRGEAALPLVQFVWWALHEESAALSLSYAPLPPPLRERALAMLRDLRIGDRPALASAQ